MFMMFCFSDYKDTALFLLWQNADLDITFPL